MNPAISRRELVSNVTALGLVAGFPSILSKPSEQPTLVLIMLRGGADGLALVHPIGDPEYSRIRTAKQISSKRLPIGPDGFFSFHPSLAPLEKLYSEGQLAVLPAASTMYRGHSHHLGQKVLDSGTLSDGAAGSGWLGRALNMVPAAEQPTVFAASEGALACLQGSLGRVSRLGESNSHAGELLTFHAHLPAFGRLLSKDDKTFVHRSFASCGLIGTEASEGTEASAEFVRQVRRVCQVLQTARGSRIAVVESFGWDTHYDQGDTEGRIAALLTGLSTGICQISAMDKALWNATTVMVVSEFGRTVQLNCDGGTDHGLATVALLAGGAVRGGRVVGSWPGLDPDRLAAGKELRPTVDLSSVFKGALQVQFDMSRDKLDHVFPDSTHTPTLASLFRPPRWPAH
jgi:uncharacterized protein (DUF1501 family)